jgi:LPXTG-site transpeptidase (sortase) family protein
MDNTYFQSEIHRLLKLGPDLSKPYQPEVTPAAPAAEAAISPAVPFNLPMTADDIVPKFGPVAQEQVEQPSFQLAPQDLSPLMRSLPKPEAKQSRGISGIIVYPFVFALAFAFFYVVLNFNALLAQVQSWFAKSEEEVVLEQDLTEYNNWIGGYFFSIQDKDKLGPNEDIDFDGLTNLDEFGIKSNPTISDSDGDGISDGIEAINGTNPWGSGQMSKKQKELLSKLDMIKINNRISLNASVNSTNLLGTHTENFDTTKPGRLSIPRLQIQVPLIWTQDPAQFDQDLTRGVVHYPGTALPGESGMVYVSGHSSDYFWKNHPYKQVFAKINALQPGDDIFVDVYGIDGKIYNYRYKVVSETIYAPDDQRQFLDNSGAKLNLSTCWPIGTQKDRYVVTAELENL